MSHVVVAIISRKVDGGDFQHLLVKSKKDFGEFSDCWYPPGGHLEEGEDERTGLIRELKEELGLDIVPIERLAESEGDIKDQITPWWKCETGADELKINASEIADAGWFSRSEMEFMRLWPATRLFFETYQ